MIEVRGSNDDYSIYGYISLPEVTRSNRNHMTTIVNGRVVTNVEVNKAINDGYYTYKPDIKYPIVVLNIDTDPTIIDVNINEEGKMNSLVVERGRFLSKFSSF